MKKAKNYKGARGYMELCLHMHKGDDLYLIVPTVWDETEMRWIGFVKTPKTKMLITATGKDSFDLQNDFNKALSKLFQSDLADEIFSMFKPLEHWNDDEQ